MCQLEIRVKHYKLIPIIYLFYQLKMTSYLIDKLEALKEDENKLKEQQRILHEEIELEIEKKRRLELDGTIIKLRTQVDEFGKNIEGKIMRDNFPLLREQETTDYQKACDKFNNDVNQGLIDDDEAKKQRQCLVDRKQKEDAKYSEWRQCLVDRKQKEDAKYREWRKTNPLGYSSGEMKMNDEKITLEKFKDNLSKVTKEIKDKCHISGSRLGKSYIELPQEIKIYDDIIPIFTTMIGIMKKQEYEIDSLKAKLCK